MTHPSTPIPSEPNLRGDRTFETSRSWRRRFFIRTAPFAAYWILLGALGIWLNLPYTIFLAVVLGTTTLLSTYRQGIRRTLTIGSRGVTYQEPPTLRFESAWSNVDRAVQLSSDPDSVALLLIEPGTRIGDSRRLVDALRTTRYPFMRTVPLQPFIDTFRGSELDGRLRELVAHAFARPIERLALPAPTFAARVLGSAIVLLPGVATIAVAQARGEALVAFPTFFAIFVTTLLLARRRGWTGERLPDAVGRSLLHPATGEPRFGALVPIAFLYLFVFGVGFVGPQLTARPSGPSCTAAAFGSTSPAAEPFWPGTPAGSLTLALGRDWRTGPLTEAGVRSVVSGSASFVDSYLKTVRGYIRNGLVQFAVTNLSSGGVMTLYLYELSCAETATQSDIVFPGDHPSGSNVSEATRDHVVIGSRTFVLASYRLTETDGVALFRIYEWPMNGHMFRLVTRTDGPGDPHGTIEAILANV